MDVAELVRTQRKVNALSVRDLAALSRVAPSTITRIESGELDPTAGILSRILVNLGLTLAPLPETDPAASAAARIACDPTYAGQRPAAVTELLDGWERIRLAENGFVIPDRERDLVFRAARLDRFTKRGGKEYLAKSGWEEIAESFAAEPQLRWALTGGGAANRFTNVGGDQQQQFYVPDVAMAARAAKLKAVPPGYLGLRVTLIQFNGIYEAGRTMDPDGLWLADPWQVAIDCLTGSLAGEAQADAILGRRP